MWFILTHSFKYINNSSKYASTRQQTRQKTIAVQLEIVWVSPNPRQNQMKEQPLQKCDTVKARIGVTASDQPSGHATSLVTSTFRALPGTPSPRVHRMASCPIVELLFVFVEAVFVFPRSEELGIAT